VPQAVLVHFGWFGLENNKMLWRTNFFRLIRWSLHYKMDPIPAREKLRRKNPETDSLMTPTMAGGLFAANRGRVIIIKKRLIIIFYFNRVLYRNWWLRPGHAHLGRRKLGFKNYKAFLKFLFLGNFIQSKIFIQNSWMRNEDE
jgi:hypothetical protein